MLAIVFIAAAVAWTAVSLALSFRQARHVRHHRDRVPADFAAHVSLTDHRKAADYTVARERVAAAESVADLAVAVGWAAGGIGLLHAGLATLLPPGLPLGVGFLVGTGVVGTLVGLPFALYRAFAVEARFGFNRTTPATFAGDRVKGWIITLAVAVPLLTAALWVMRAATGLWWLWTWAGLTVLMLAAPTVYVRLVAPRFNRFTPLPEGELRRRIEGLLQSTGFRSSGLFTMDASRRTAHGNAYFIGFGRTKRIVLFDTLLDKSPPAEVEAVIAHELGHFRHRHVLYGLLRGAAVTFVALAAFGWLCRQPWLLPAFGVRADDDAVRLFVCLLLASVVGPLLSPVGNWISRRNEFQADAFAARAVGAEPMIGALTRLTRDNASTLTPDPLYALAHYSHPPVPLRVAQLRTESQHPAAGAPLGPVAGAAVGRS